MTQALASPETDERPRTNVAIQRAVRDGLPTPKQRNAKARQLKAKVQAFWERVCAASPHEPVHTNDTVDRDRGVAALKSEVIAPTPLPHFLGRALARAEMLPASPTTHA